MPKYTLFFLILSLNIYAETIDKKKILEIIKAAKQHKTVPSIDKSKISEKKIASADSKSIIVYRKRTAPTVYKKRDEASKATLMKTNYSALPSIAPSSVELRKRFNLEQKKETQKSTPLFKTPVQNKNKKVNTTAIKIQYF